MVTLKEFKNAIKFLSEHTDEAWTYHWILGQDNKRNNWALVLGWLDGYEPDEDDNFEDDGYHICAKIAYQPANSIMTEYDIDWTMPYDEETGQVDETEMTIYESDGYESEFNWLMKVWNTYKEDMVA